MLFKKPFLNNPSEIFFRSKEQIERYHNKKLNKLKDVFNLPNLQYHWTASHKPIYSNIPHIDLKTSGTTTGAVKYYRYSNNSYYLIEYYHMKRLMFFNGIENGTFARLIQPQNHTEKLGLETKPIIDRATGGNVTYHIKYNGEQDENFWIQNFIALDGLGISVLYCRPAEYELFRSILPKIGERKYHIMFSSEILPPHVRANAKKWFISVIDKMRCWDGGFSFFECRYGTKHVNDELAIVESLEDGKIISTDLFNHSQLFYKYWNGDYGKLSMRECDCGLFGTVLDELQGRQIEFIVTDNGSLIPGTVLINYIFGITEKWDQNQGLDFYIEQHENKDIDLHFSQPLSPDQAHEIISMILRVAASHDPKPLKIMFVFDNKYNHFTGLHRSKRLLTTSKALKPKDS